MSAPVDDDEDLIAAMLEAYNHGYSGWNDWVDVLAVVREQDPTILALRADVTRLTASLVRARDYIAGDREATLACFSGPSTKAVIAEADDLLAQIDAALSAPAS